MYEVRQAWRQSRLLPESGERVLGRFATIGEAEEFAASRPSGTYSEEFWGEPAGVATLEPARIVPVIIS